VSRTGRRPGTPETREDILVAARRAFADRGYEATSLRSIANRVHVDPALLMHYFGSKEGLFLAALEVTFEPSALFSGLDNLDSREAARLIVDRYLSVLDQERTRDVVLSLVRSAVSSERAATMLREFLVEEMLASLGALIGRPDGQLRASLVVAQLIGIAMLRHVVKLEPVVRASRDELVSVVAPLSRVIFADDVAGPTSALAKVPLATIYHKIRGTGPLLLMLQGGDGDADDTDAFAAHLINRYTALNWDRRGPSRSRSTIRAPASSCRGTRRSVTVAASAEQRTGTRVRCEPRRTAGLGSRRPQP